MENRAINRRSSILQLQVSLLLMLGPLISPVRGDGLAFKGIDRSDMSPLVEREQRAYIDCRDGVQRMLLAIDVPLEPNEHGVWIVPLPADAKQITVDLLDEFPRIHGRDVRRAARQILQGLFAVIQCTQLYPLPFHGCLLPTLSRSRDVDVAGAVERFGLRTEVIAAPSIDALHEHLRAAGARVTIEQLASLKPYFAETSSHAYIVTWIASWDQVEQTFSTTQRTLARAGGRTDRTLALFMSFPSDVAYFPMRASSAYGSQVVPVHLKLSGFVQPQTKIELRHDDKSVAHFRGAGPLRWAGNRLVTTSNSDSASASKGARYTRFQLETSADRFVDDLRFVPASSRGLALAEWLVNADRTWWLVLTAGALLVLFFSYLSAGIAGLCVRRRWRGCARLGLWNCATLYGLYTGLRDSKNPQAVAMRQTPGQRGKFLLIFTFVFMAMSIAFQALANALLAMD